MSRVATTVDRSRVVRTRAASALALALAVALSLVLSGCTSQAPSAAATPSPAAAATATPTFAATVTPTLSPTPSPTPEPTGTPTPTAPPTPEPTASPTPDEGWVTIAQGFRYKPLDEDLKRRITGISFPADDPDVRIRYGDLRYIALRHVDFEGRVREGELIVHATLAREVTEIFLALYEARYPLASVGLVDDFGEPGGDNLSMAANNTSAFNYRYVTGTRTLSRHSFGAAIDINPLFNPYLHDGLVSPPEAAAYVDRTREFPGKIDHDDLCYRLFTERGWSWGGDWQGDKDYQHFSKPIG